MLAEIITPADMVMLTATLQMVCSCLEPWKGGGLNCCGESAAFRSGEGVRVPRKARAARPPHGHRAGRAHERLDAEQDRADLQRGRPLVLEDVEADAPELVRVGMVELGDEADFGWRHGVAASLIGSGPCEACRN